MAQRRNGIIVFLIIVISCVIMALVEAVLGVGYGIKSAVKLMLFFVVPLLILSRHKSLEIKSLFQIKGKMLLKPILLGAGVYIFIITAYITIGSLFDFSQVAVAITNSSGVEKEQFVWVALYISFVNSLLEEFFFRGIGFLILRQISSRRFAYVFSAAAFSLYHVAIMSSWFSIYLFLLLLVSLFVAGLMFNWLNDRRGSIYTSWLVHMCANFAINTIGFILFGIID